MRTIVQEYGPIYGEPVNGTVQGRPNGSVFVPSTNKISLSLDEDIRYYKYYDATRLHVCNSAGTTSGNWSPVMTALSQDLSSNMQLQLYSDAACTALVASRNAAAGNFNIEKMYVLYDAVEGLTDGQTLYLRAQLMNNGVAVATSDTIEVTMVVPS